MFRVPKLWAKGLLIALALIGGVSSPANAGWKSKLLAAGAAGSVVLSHEAAGLVAAAVAVTAATTCEATNCADNLVEFIQRHRIVGKTIVRRELSAYSKKHPEQQDQVADIRLTLEQTVGGGFVYKQQSEKRPTDCPPGTIDIDKAKTKYGWSKERLHKIKGSAHGGMSSGKSWTGITPDGTVGINEDGHWAPQGHWGDLL